MVTSVSVVNLGKRVGKEGRLFSVEPTLYDDVDALIEESSGIFPSLVFVHDCVTEGNVVFASILAAVVCIQDGVSRGKVESVGFTDL